MTPREPSGTAARQDKVTETLVAGTVLGRVKAEPHLDGSSSNGGQRLSDYFQPDTTDADTALATITEIYGAHYRALVRLATLLVHDIATAEELVPDSFAALHSGLRQLPDSDMTLSYLRPPVV